MKKGRKMAAMVFTKRGGLSVFIFVFLISALVFVPLSTPSAQAEAQTNLVDTEFDYLTILHIGDGVLASQLADHFQEMGSNVIHWRDIREGVELSPEVLIIFGGEWFEGRVYDAELHNFLRLASSRGASMVMVGGATSKFFEALDRAGLYEIPVTETGIVRNPASFNPPLVGFRMKTADGYTFPSILFSCSTDVDDLEEALIGWCVANTSSSLSILHIGDGTLATQLVARLEGKGSDVIRSSDIPEAVKLNPEVLIIFGGEWFEGRVYDAELHNFLRLASSRGASMVIVGGATSKFFEALDRAGLYEIPVTETGIVRNPAYFNPPLVGFRMKTAEGYAFPSLLFSCSTSVDNLEEGLVGWLRSTAPAVLALPNLQLTTEYNYSPLLDSNPQGRLNLVAGIYKLSRYGMPGCNQYVYQVNIESVPGAVAYGSSYRNEHTWAYHQVFNAGAYRRLADYGPTTMYGTTTVDVSPGAGLGPAWSYSISDVKVLDYSDYSQHVAYWQHDLPRSTSSYLARPGFVVETTQDHWSFVDGWYKVRFVKRPFWCSKTLESPTLYLDAFLAAD